MSASVLRQRRGPSSRASFLQHPPGPVHASTMLPARSLTSIALLFLVPVLVDAAQCPTGTFSSTGQTPNCVACAPGTFQNSTPPPLPALARWSPNVSLFPPCRHGRDVVPPGAGGLVRLRSQLRRLWGVRIDGLFSGHVPAAHRSGGVSALPARLVLQRVGAFYAAGVPARSLLGYAGDWTRVSPVRGGPVPATERPDLLLLLVSILSLSYYCCHFYWWLLWLC